MISSAFEGGAASFRTCFSCAAAALALVSGLGLADPQPAGVPPTATNRQAANLGLPGPRAYFTVKPDDFDRLRIRNTNAIVLDVRTTEEFNQGHIPGARLIDFRSVDFKEKVEKLDREKYYLVHCAAGGRSAKACVLMHELGFKHLVNLSGGMEAWKGAGKPVE